MERTLKSLESVLAQQFSEAVERQDSYSDEDDTGQFEPSNSAVQNRQAVAQLATVLAHVKLELADSVEMKADAEPKAIPEGEKLLWQLFETAVERQPSYSDEDDTGEYEPTNSAIQNRQAIAQLAEAIVETRKAFAAEERVKYGIPMPGKASSGDSHTL